MKKESNEVKYKLAELLLKKMQESGLINEEEREKIAVLNMETFPRNLQKYICKNARYNEKSVVVYVANKGVIP